MNVDVNLGLSCYEKKHTDGIWEESAEEKFKPNKCKVKGPV